MPPRSFQSLRSVVITGALFKQGGYRHFENFIWPYHLAATHRALLTSSIHYTEAASSPLNPTEDGRHPNMHRVVDISEDPGASMEQPCAIMHAQGQSVATHLESPVHAS